MRDVIRRALWRVNFIDALQLVGQASARLPFGVPDPVLHGSSAVELYTGGLWSAADLDLYALEPRPLIAELFGMGCRWAERPRRGGRGLWHPELHIGINIGSGGTPSDLAELSNVLTVINDLDFEQHAQSSLKVIGIEDLIAAQVAGCLMLRTPYSEAASLTQVLIECPVCIHIVTLSFYEELYKGSSLGRVNRGIRQESSAPFFQVTHARVILLSAAGVGNLPARPNASAGHPSSIWKSPRGGNSRRTA
jgi:hypothetical protein